MSQLICRANQLTGFYVKGALTVKGLNDLRERELCNKLFENKVQSTKHPRICFYRNLLHYSILLEDFNVQECFLYFSFNFGKPVVLKGF